MLNIIEIKGFNAPELDVYARLTEAQLLNKDHPEDGMFIAESPKVIGRGTGWQAIRLCQCWRNRDSWKKMTKPDRFLEDMRTRIFQSIQQILICLRSSQVQTDPRKLCAMHRRPLQNYLELCAGKSRIAILENVMNPTNVGAIFRSAAALHMEAVLLTPGCSDPLYRRASRVSMGTGISGSVDVHSG